METIPTTLINEGRRTKPNRPPYILPVFAKPFFEKIGQDFVGIIISALIFVVSFLWKDLLSDIEQIYFPRSKGILGRIIYILVVTLLILIFVIFLRTILQFDNTQQTADYFRFEDTPDRPTSDPSDLEIGDLDGGDPPKGL